MSEEKLYTIQPISGKGSGVIANSKITRGIRILSERPLFKIPSGTNNPNQIEPIIVRELKTLSKDQQRAFLYLHNAHKSDIKSAFHGVAKTNALPLGINATEGGIFLDASRINHSCSQNAQNTWNERIDRLTIHAIRDTEQGEGITISYLGGSETYSQRQNTLQQSFRFTCTCPLCTLPAPERLKSDDRLREITRLDAKIGDGTLILLTPLTALRNADTLLLLLREEQIQDVRIARLYYDAFQITIANGDLARAKVFVGRALQERFLLEGGDSAETMRAEGLEKDPTMHRLYGVGRRWRQGIEKVPVGLGEEEFEEWLWRRE
jgi:hypothetical protein